MKVLRIVVLLSCLIVFGSSAIAAERLRLATTTSTENSGLLAELLPPFEKANDCVVDVIAVGTGKAIKLGETGDVDDPHSGPDRPALETQIQQLDLQDRVTLLPWQDDPVPIYSALDLLLIPSRFEGVPLVMLEALCFGLPVIGSDRDGMRDLLPEAWRFEPENEAALAETFRRVTAEPQDQQIKLLSKKIREEMNILSFKSNFTASVLTFKQGHF